MKEARHTADVAIVGAGPAGLAAARVLIDAGLRIAVIDEQQRPGGQIFRQPPPTFHVRKWLTDAIYQRGKILLRDLESDQRIQWRLGTCVLGIEAVPREEGTPATHTLVMNGPDGIARLSVRHVVIAPGCYDMPVPMDGAMLPGVMAAGGIQAFLKSQQVLVADRLILTGTHPLQLILADQIVRAGGQVLEVLFAQSLRNILGTVARSLPDVMGSGQVLHFFRVLWRLRRAGVAVRFSQVVVRAEGEGRLSRVTVANVNDAAEISDAGRRTVECDRMGLCFGFLASSELTRQVGVQHAWSDAAGGWLCRHDEFMRTNVPGISVAGEVTGIEGANVAFEEGRIAALGVLRDLGRCTQEQAAQQAAVSRRRLVALKRFAGLLQTVSSPKWKLLEQLAGDDALLCKCEEVSVASVRGLLAENSTIFSANGTKLLSRVGMGLCQGRYCNYFLTRLITSRGNIPAAAVGPFSAQFPAKPVCISQLIRRCDSAKGE